VIIDYLLNLQSILKYYKYIAIFIYKKSAEIL